MLVDRLALVVVFGMQLAIGAGDRLRRFVGLEAQIARLMFLRQLLVAQAVVAEHQVVVRLQVFGIDGQHRLQNLHRIVVFALQKQHAPQIVQRHAIARILRQHYAQIDRRRRRNCHRLRSTLA